MLFRTLSNILSYFKYLKFYMPLIFFSKYTLGNYAKNSEVFFKADKEIEKQKLKIKMKQILKYSN